MAFMMCIGVWSILELFVEELIMLWIIGGSVFVVVVTQKWQKENENEGREKK